MRNIGIRMFISMFKECSRKEEASVLAGIDAMRDNQQEQNEPTDSSLFEKLNQPEIHDLLFEQAEKIEWREMVQEYAKAQPLHFQKEEPHGNTFPKELLDSLQEELYPVFQYELDDKNAKRHIFRY